MDKVSYVLDKAVTLEVAKRTCLPWGDVCHAAPVMASFAVIITMSVCVSKEEQCLQFLTVEGSGTHSARARG